VSDTDAFTLRPSRPAFVPRTTGRRQETTGTAGASNPQVRNQIRPSPQVANPAPRTLSRWRHGFEPRWDYQVRACIGESRLPVAPHWPRGVHGAVTDQNSVSSGECSDRVPPFKPFLARREGGAEGGLSRHLPCCTLGTTTRDDALPPRCRWVRSHGGVGQSRLQRLMWQNDWFRETRGACGTARRSERRRVVVSRHYCPTIESVEA
jgi:hypothetical protein